MTININNTLEIIKNTVCNNKLFDDDDVLLLMVSGGCDSVAMTYLLCKLYKNKKVVLHINHMLRPQANSDQRFVKNLCAHLKLDFYTFKANISAVAKEKNTNIEFTGRQIRYYYANLIKERLSIKFNKKIEQIKICTAHTLNDRVETFFMRTIVGTGVDNLRGMKYSTKRCIHPLLDVERKDLITYIHTLKNPYKDENNKLWHEDLTNYDTKRFRSFTRRKLIPLAKTINPNLFNNLKTTMNLVADESDYIDEIANREYKKCVNINKDCCYIKPTFNTLDNVIKKRVSYKALQEIFSDGTRITNRTIESVITASQINNYTDNIQNNYSIHSNKRGIYIMPMLHYRQLRNRLQK